MKISKKQTAQALAMHGRKLVVLKNKAFRKGSKGLRDATSNSDEIGQLCELDPNHNPAFPTGEMNSVVALSIKMPKYKGVLLVSPIAYIKKLLDGTGVDLAMVMQKSLLISAGNTEFILLFKNSGEKLYSKKAIFPGVDLLGEYDQFPLPPSTVRQGRQITLYEWVNQDEDGNIDLSNDPFANLCEVPSWVRSFSDLPTPFDGIWKGEVTLQGAEKSINNGCHGKDNKREFHDALCLLRGLGVEKGPFFEYATSGALASTPVLDDTWALGCAWYVWSNYQATYLETEPSESGVSALLESIG